MKKSSAGDVDVELLKAVAQAWHAQSGNPRPSRASETSGDDSDAREAVAAAAAAPPRETAWDFAQSLLDTYELVAVARRLESGLVIADHAAAAALAVPPREAGKRARESRRSLRSLLLRSTSRRFEEPKS
ncbi:uncharacterized protein LOC101775322 [Setaria italica]|uniref:uncharacterized protein LOC101775322 n=1 Tax=Setaria italica TaxID=4555 RepID=UPI000BE4BEEA|nr:uncharacterized protein LOC101775322 [Setaria italica]